MHITFTPIPGDLTIRARLEPDGLSINGKLHLWDGAPAMVEYGEENGLKELVCLTRDHTYQVIQSTWVDPTPPPEPDPVAEAQAALEEWRATATADAWQIIAVLGPERWKVIVEWAAGQNFVTQTLVEKAVNIPRNSEMVQVLAWILGLSDTEVDEIFRQAAELRA